MTPQGKPIKASCNDTVAAGAWAFESTETWEAREWCYKGQEIWAGHLDGIFSSTLSCLHTLHTSHTRSPSVGTPELECWSSISQAQELKHVHTSSAPQTPGHTPLPESLKKNRQDGWEPDTKLSTQWDTVLAPKAKDWPREKRWS